MPNRVAVAGVFYAAFAAAAVIWNLLAGRPIVELLWRPAATPRSLLVGVLIGGAFGLSIVALSRWMVRQLSWARELYVWFGALLGPVSWRDALLLAALSALGEELFFRGAMQPTLGLALTTTIFGAMHIPPRLSLAGWTIAAAVLGLVFGLLTDWTANLAGALVAHFAINLLNLRHVTEFSGSER